jgi:fructokinase
MNRKPNPAIVTIGEVVWDMFPDRQVLGGAPVNVAYHLSKLREKVLPITRVGNDRLGEETIEKMGQLGLRVEGVQRDSGLATGRVRVELGMDNEPHFEIVAPAAWDSIDSRQAFDKIAGQPFQLVFGTLGQRNEVSRSAIRALMQKAAFCYYDVNLRPPFTGQELVMDSLDGADLVKVNQEELTIICNWLALGKGEPKDLAESLRHRFGLTALAVTRGADGALLATAESLFEEAGVAVAVVDTVGAGDAFFAALIAGYRAGLSWQRTLALANARGAYVASCRGATPPIEEGPIA